MKQIVSLGQAAWRRVHRAGLRALALTLGVQLIIVIIAFPVVRWIFHEAIRASGMVALDLSALELGSGLIVTLGLLIVLTIIVFWLLSVQFTIMVLLLRPQGTPGLRELGTELGRVFRKIVRPSSFPLVGYLFLVLPLAGFGFTSFFLQRITVPAFISGELMKSVSTQVIWVVFLLVIGTLNLRWALTMPIFALTDATGGQALRRSWRLTRGDRALHLLVAGGGLSLLVTVVMAAVFALSLVPVFIADAVVPDASVWVGAASLGIAMVLILVLSTVMSLAIAAVLMTMLERVEHELAEPLTTRGDTAGGRQPRVRWFIAACTVIAVVFTGVSAEAITRVVRHPETLVLAHRGFSEGGVENTISGLVAAAEAGSDLVEIDVMQAKDGGFVIMHDANLSRLANDGRLVKDLTFDELTQITVHDLFGNEDLIPSLADYMMKAQELEMTLLVEIKLSGAEQDDHVDMLVDELEDLGVLGDHIYHSLDPVSVARLKQLRPDLSVGYTMAFAGDGAPDTPADFIVVEGWTATQAVQDAAQEAGLGFMAWTINDETEIRDLLRRGVDGIITDHPDVAIAQRDAMHEERGLAPVLTDLFNRFVRGL